jgi:hypothetical protein
MIARLRGAAVLATMYAACSGCCSTGCGSRCGDGASYAFSKYDCSCDPCSHGNSCGAGCCSQSTGSRPILDALCGCSACGELYWNEWYNDPPACREPCDACGNYTGAGGGYYGAPHQGHSHYAGAKSHHAKPLHLAEAPESAPEEDDFVR